jgi:Uma2 family endonuclease
MTAAARKDPTVYPVEDDVGEDLLQTLIAEMLRPLIAALFAKRGEKALVGADQYIYWQQYAPRKVVAPDIYVLPGVDPDTRVRSWKVWETGIVPSFALEIVSADDKKDVELSPERYDELGTPEVVIFDPEHTQRDDGVRFRVHRRLARRGLTLVEATNADRVRSKALGCFLRVVGSGAKTRLRVGLGKDGEELLPTQAERAEGAEAELAEARRELARYGRAKKR